MPSYVMLSHKPIYYKRNYCPLFHWAFSALPVFANLEPFLEGEPAEGVDDELPLAEVGGLVDAGEVAGDGADGTQHVLQQL